MSGPVHDLGRNEPFNRAAELFAAEKRGARPQVLDQRSKQACDGEERVVHDDDQSAHEDGGDEQDQMHADDAGG